MDHNRRILMAALCGLAAAPRSVAAQQPRRTYRVAHVFTTASLRPGRFFATLRSRLAGKGFVDGENLDLRFFSLRPEEEAPQSPQRLIREVIAWQPDAMVAAGVTCAKRLRAATSTIPIVFYAIQDPQSQRLVETLARPGVNATGTGVHYDELGIKRLELVRELLPSARRVAVLTDRSLGGISPAGRDALSHGSKRLGLAITEIDVGSLAQGLCDVARLARQAQSEAALTWGSIDRPASLAGVKDWYARCAMALQREARIPLVDDNPAVAEEGVAAALGDDEFDSFRRAADMVGDILLGSSPATLPVDMQMRVRMFVNERTLRELGVELPASVRVRADRIVN